MKEGKWGGEGGGERNIKQDKGREGGEGKSIRGLFSSYYLPAYPF